MIRKRFARSLALAALPLIALQGGAALGQTAPPPAYPAPPTAPAGAPNVIVIMTDDVGYASGSTFGGAIPTPTMDRLAANGLRYGNFHVNALCSPSRAALLTGRNAHAVGFGNVADAARADPGYNSIIPKSAASIGRILKTNGYDTAWFGKNHTIPMWQKGPLGPYDQWASGLGFDYFYGFQGGHTDQFSPALVENESTIEPPQRPGYILDEDLADHAIQWIRAQKAQGGDRPFLIHYAPGTAHGPLQAPADWIARFKGKFDGGWDVLRRETFARQKRLGVIPADATLAPPPPGLPAWDSLSPDQKRLSARYMEVFAAQLAFCDFQIGRIVDALKDSGQLDNTIVVYIQGDNGASPEGGLNGAINYSANLNAAARKPEASPGDLARIDEIGGPSTYPIGPVGWAVAMNTPFPYFKTMSSRLGGITDGMVISWPKGIKARGERAQFTHLVDVLPTILDAAGLKAPDSVDGVAQQPFDGVSFAYSFTQPRAPSRHRTQYFEVMGNAALYQDGWLAASPARFDAIGKSAPPALDPQWELYDLTKDSSQTIDVAAQHPEKLRDLRAVFDAEAQRNHVLPIRNDTAKLLLPEGRPELQARPGRYLLVPSAFRYGEGSFPSIKNRSWSAEADLVVPTGGGDGVLVTEGGRFSGWGLAVLGGAPTFLYRDADGAAALTRLAGAGLTPGPHKVRLDFTIDGVGLGKGGTAKLSVDGKPAGATHLARTVAFKFSPEGAAVGHDTGTPLVDDYRVPAPYDGLRSVTIELGPVQTP